MLLQVLWCAKLGTQHVLWMGEVQAARIQLVMVPPASPFNYAVTLSYLHAIP